ncbi:MAG: DUF362 domain-containing protein [Clostridia bacterium]|nr:DUF362 domain-containing protein [Clostridia bacterium]
MNRASLYGCDSYDLDKVTLCIEKIIDDFGGLDNLLKKGKKVVIKPNLVMKKSPDGAATTHPCVIEALINILKRKTDDITIAECPGGAYTKERMSSIFAVTGMSKVAERTGAKLYLDYQQVALPCRQGKVTRNITVLEPFSSADVFINVSKLKSHGLTVFTGTAKNLYGLIPGLEKAQIHARFPDKNDFADFICDINTTIVPDLSILDGIVAMEGNGPTGGNPRHCGVLIASNSTYTADLAGCAVCNFDYREIPMFISAVKRGICPDGLENVTVTGDNLSDYIVRDFKKPDTEAKGIIKLLTQTSNPFVRKLIRSKPVINKKKCVGCGECVNCCPQKTIEIKSKKAFIHRENCIYCYCCQELCPMKAVDIKRFFLLNLIK